MKNIVSIFFHFFFLLSSLLDPPKIVSLPRKYYAAVQESVSLYCQAVGNPPLSFSWSPCNPQENVCGDSWLNISEVLNDGTYNCTVSNSLGIDSTTFNLGKSILDKFSSL